MEKPKIQIVNNKDEIIGHKSRDQVDYEKDIFRTAALWLTNSKGEILIAQRKLTKDKDPGKWGPAVAGTVEEGETYDSNMYKEAEEEIGLKGVRFARGPKHLFRHVRTQYVQWFTAVIDRPTEKFRLQEDEVEQVAWTNKDELIQDVKLNPDKYVPSMPAILKLFYNL